MMVLLSELCCKSNVGNVFDRRHTVERKDSLPGAVDIKDGCSQVRRSLDCGCEFGLGFVLVNDELDEHFFAGRNLDRRLLRDFNGFARAHVGVAFSIVVNVQAQL